VGFLGGKHREVWALVERDGIIRFPENMSKMGEGYMKCQKCNKAEAVVYYGLITSKSNVVKKFYCHACMELERAPTTPLTTHQNGSQLQTPQSLMDLIKEKTGNKTEAHNDGKVVSSAMQKVITLERDMKIAIGEERYEDAAKIRDEITTLKKSDGLPNH
jgi:protein-arginine kinase activator protein McsA